MPVALDTVAGIRSFATPRARPGTLRCTGAAEIRTAVVHVVHFLAQRVKGWPVAPRSIGRRHAICGWSCGNKRIKQCYNRTTIIRSNANGADNNER